MILCLLVWETWYLYLCSKAVLGVSFCIASSELDSIRVWMENSLPKSLGINWSVIVVGISLMTIFGLVNTIIKVRFVHFSWIFPLFSKFSFLLSNSNGYGGHWNFFKIFRFSNNNDSIGNLNNKKSWIWRHFSILF